MADACGRDLTQFERWYTQAGTPRLALSVQQTGSELEVTFRQLAPRGQESFAALHMPVRFALLDPQGVEVALDAQGRRQNHPRSHSPAFRQFGPLTSRPSRHQPSRRL